MALSSQGHKANDQVEVMLDERFPGSAGAFYPARIVKITKTNIVVQLYKLAHYKPFSVCVMHK